VMAYEAQIAGLTDNNPSSLLLSWVARLLKHFSVSDVAHKRQIVADFLLGQQYSLTFFNGGGTGSLRSSVNEACLTEVTAGSGFLQSVLFDYYTENQNCPAFCFALQMTRHNTDAIVCQSGGFIASGAVSQDKCPVVFLPKGLHPFSSEGFGEVQSPFYQTNRQFNILQHLQLGDPIFCRPAKAGEIAEHFNFYLLHQKNHSHFTKAKTYRGYNQNFF